MKRYLILVLLALSAPFVLSAENNITEDFVSVDMPCYNTKELFETLTNKYKEAPLIAGKTSDIAGSTMTLWLHPVDKTWTIVASKDDVSCVVGTGTDFKLLTRKLRNAI